MAGIPFSINSGKRTVGQNKNAGGVEDSSHLTGYAVDIKCIAGDAPWKIINSLIQIGFTRIGVAETFVHTDCDTTKPSKVIWTYK